MNNPVFNLVYLQDILPTKLNSRKVNIKSEEFKELYDSIKADGVKIPVVVRPHPTREGLLELLTGRRRYEASNLAKRKTIPALIYNNMSDDEAYDMTFIENFGRLDLTPLEESEAVATLLTRNNNDPLAVAAKLGKSERWVLLRSNIHVNLAGIWVEEIKKPGSIYSHFTAGHLDLIARFDHESQCYLHSQLPDYSDDISIKDLNERCNEILRDVSKAIWDTNKPVQFGDESDNYHAACVSCNNRSSCQPLLWDNEVEAADVDRCLNPLCWREHLFASLHHQIKTARKRDPDIILAYNDNKFGSQYEEYFIEFGDLEDTRCFVKSKKDDPESRGYFVVYGARGICKVEWLIDQEAGRSIAKKPASEKSLEEKYKELESKRWCYIIGQLLFMLPETHCEQIDRNNKLSVIIALISQFGTEAIFGGNANWEVIDEVCENSISDNEDLKNVLFELVVPRLEEVISYNGPAAQIPASKIKHAERIIDLFAFDKEALWAEAIETCPEPKSWTKIKRTFQ